MARRAISRLSVARRRAVAAAIIGGTEVRAALDDFPRNFDLGQPEIEAVLKRAAARVIGNAACFLCISSVLGRVPVTGPLPDIANHVVKAIAVRRKRSCWGCPPVAAGREI